MEKTIVTDQEPQEQTVGDYRIIQELGKGGFGSVFKGETLDGQLVALKVLNPQALGDKRVVKKFFHEAMILAKLDHPNICKLIEFFPDGENYALVMEYVEGTELKQVLQKAKNANGLMPFELAYKIAKQSLSAFQYAFEQGILHRDIKPANIMIDKNGNCKIMDFGIARMSQTASHNTASSMLSIRYVPPERFDRGSEIDQRSDIYSLGLVFYEMFAGRPPFDVEEMQEVMFWHMNEIPQPPEEFVKGLPREISEAISKSLEKDPADRFNDFREFSQAMLLDEEIVEDVAQKVEKDESKVAKKRVVKKKQTPLLLPIVIAAVVLALGIGGFIFYKGSLPGKEEAKSTPGVPVVAAKPAATKAVEKGPPGSTKNSKGFFEVISAKDESIMVLIPEGPFKMGSDAYSAEKPVQQVSLSQYTIDKYLVTNKQFQKFVGETEYVTDAEKEGSGMVRPGRRWKKVPGASWRKPDGTTTIEGKDDHPVTQVSYNDARKYCQWAGKDLPTEAQWEKAARGPNGNEYPWGDSQPDDTNANFDSIVGSTTPVKQYEKGQSFYGLHDMAGNVYQWIRDWYATSERQPQNPTGPAEGKERVVKGGSFMEGMESLRSANRDRYEPNYSSVIFGIRCASEKSEPGK